jgi:benzoate/toluate 1,2-dioxygenase beta subunit/2,4,5-trichlorophenoxyacetic acid oxygenase 2
MPDLHSTGIAQELLSREGLFLDRQQWSDWLALYTPDCVYWLPSWRADDTLISDVRREVSMIYHAGREGLQDRVVRIESRKSVTAMPLPRTTHLVGNIVIEQADARNIAGAASWTVHLYDPRSMKQHVLFGRYEFGLQKVDADWRLARKKIVLANDRVPAVIDFYCL